jgi:hypothetical protein
VILFFATEEVSIVDALFFVKQREKLMKSCLKVISNKILKYYMVIFLKNKEKSHFKDLNREILNA